MAAIVSATLITSHAPAATTRTDETTTRTQPAIIANIPLSATDRARASQWHLALKEWRRYKWLMRGIRGSLSPHISPVEALGIAARTPTERKHYARLWARMMARDTAHVLAFQRAYDAAWRTLYPNMKAVSDGWPSQPGTLEAGDRLLFFTRSRCPTCDRTLARLLTTVSTRHHVGLDIYLAGAVGDNAIRAWARHHAIPIAAVKRGAITLNHDQGTLKRLTGTATYPKVLRRRGQTVTAFIASDG
jgi:integrating conjugative element protein (TIGR03759 family)